MAIAFFDLDKTLLADNSAKLWIKSQWRVGELNAKQMILASFWLFKYHLGFTNLDEVIKESAVMMQGEDSDYVLRRTRAFFNSTVRHLYRPGALKKIDEHRAKGHVIALLTSSFDGLSELVQNHLNLDHCLCTKLEVGENRLYTGKILGEPCFGRHKVTFAQNLCNKMGTPLKDCFFYTDSASDLPLLEQIGYPVSVNPDPHLRARSAMNNWEIVDWGRPSWTKKQ